MARVPKRPFMQRVFQRAPLRTAAPPAPRSSRVWTPPVKPLVTPPVTLVRPAEPVIQTLPKQPIVVEREPMPSAPMTATEERLAREEALYEYQPETAWLPDEPDEQPDQEEIDAAYEISPELQQLVAELRDEEDDVAAKKKPKHGPATRKQWREQYERRKARKAEQDSQEGKVPEPKPRKAKANGATAPALELVQSQPEPTAHIIDWPQTRDEEAERVQEMVEELSRPPVPPQQPIVPLELPKDQGFQLASLPIVEPVAVPAPTVAPEAPVTAAKPPVVHHEPRHVLLQRSITLGITAAVLGGATLGTYGVVHDVMVPMYHAGAAYRAMIPLGLEMAASGAAFWLIRRGTGLHPLVRGVLTALAMTAVLGCAYVEVVASQVAPAAAQKQEKDSILADAAHPAEVHQETTPDNVGKKGAYQFEQNQSKALDLQAQRDKRADDIMQKRLDNTKPIEGADKLPTVLGVLGTLACSCFIPSLETFLDSLFGLFVGRRRREEEQ